MDERRDPPPTPKGGRPPLAALSRLSPLQQAYAAYTEHAVSCPACRDVDRGCATAEQLWRTYRAIADDACDQIADRAR